MHILPSLRIPGANLDNRVSNLNASPTCQEGKRRATFTHAAASIAAATILPCVIADLADTRNSSPGEAVASLQPHQPSTHQLMPHATLRLPLHFFFLGLITLYPSLPCCCVLPVTPLDPLILNRFRPPPGVVLRVRCRLFLLFVLVFYTPFSPSRSGTGSAACFSSVRDARWCRWPLGDDDGHLRAP